jgi:superfamily I DNA/RNA helicase
MVHGTGHVIVEAVAGSGKTFTIVEGAKRITDRHVGLVAFNVHIKEELKRKIGAQGNVECMTYHGLGFKAVRNHVRGNCTVDKYKVLGILDDMHIPVKRSDEKTAKYRVASMVGYCKSAGFKPDVTQEDLEWIADRFDVDLGALAPVVYDLTPKVLQKCIDELATVDYDDQVWLPMVLNLPVPRYDLLCVDEYQDTGLTQQWLAIQAARRLIAVGDPRQAIYGFRGADSRGFDRLREKLGDQVVTLPLTLTRRCPKNHVRLAQSIVPQIQAMESAPDGVIRIEQLDSAVQDMRPGDLVVCRVNAELVGTAYKLLKRGVRALIRGRDLGEGLRKLVEKAELDAANDDLGYRTTNSVTLKDVLKYAGEITQAQVSKFNAMPNDRGVRRAHNAQDRYDCLCTLAEGAQSVNELKDTIARLFGDEDQHGQAVVLGTVHRTKGLEGNRVYVLRPDLIPHPMARKKDDQDGERNLGYVVVTRAKFEVCPTCKGSGTEDSVSEREIILNACPTCHTKGGLPGELIFIGDMCPMFQAAYDTIFPPQDQQPQPPDEEYEVELENGWDVDQELDNDGIPEHRRWQN